MKISVVTPSYNQGHFINETLDSVISQHYSDLDLIVIDGGSTDASVDTIKKYDKHISYWISEPDRGQSHAINKGFEKCSGEIVAWLNSDDLYSPNTLNRVREVFSAHPELDFIHAESVLFNDKGDLPSRSFNPAFYSAQLLGGLPTPQPSFFFKKELLDKVGPLNENLHYGMDYDFFLRIALAGNGRFYPEYWSKYRIHADSKTETSQLKFASDWNAVFCGLFKSAKPNQLIQQWSAYGFDVNTELVYDAHKVQPEDLQLAVGFALYHQAVFHNQAGKTKDAVKLLNHLKNDFPKVFKHFEVGRYYHKLKLKSLFS